MIERDVVACSGSVRIPDSKMTATYFNPDLDRLEDKEAKIILTPEDLYKEFRLKGFEYGPNFKLLEGGTALQGERHDEP